MDKVVKDASPNWGGKRPGGGRKPTGRKQRSIWITDAEFEKLKPYIDKIRGGK